MCIVLLSVGDHNIKRLLCFVQLWTTIPVTYWSLLRILLRRIVERKKRMITTSLLAVAWFPLRIAVVAVYGWHLCNRLSLDQKVTRLPNLTEGIIYDRISIAWSVARVTLSAAEIIPLSILCYTHDCCCSEIGQLSLLLSALISSKPKNADISLGLFHINPSV